MAYQINPETTKNLRKRTDGSDKHHLFAKKTHLPKPLLLGSQCSHVTQQVGPRDSFRAQTPMAPSLSRRNISSGAAPCTTSDCNRCSCTSALPYRPDLRIRRSASAVAAASALNCLWVPAWMAAKCHPPRVGASTIPGSQKSHCGTLSCPCGTTMVWMAQPALTAMAWTSASVVWR